MSEKDVIWFGRFMERTKLQCSLPRSCETCEYFHDFNGPEYQEGYECGVNMAFTHLKNFPFENGCKHYEQNFWMITTWDEYEEMADS